MRIKIDENIGDSAVALLRDAGHDVMTVREQGFGGADDETIYRICQSEARVLVTLDRDFGKVQRFPPHTSAGIAVLALGGAASLRVIKARLLTFLELSRSRPISGELWIVEPGRVRVHLQKDR